jgi:6-phosphofructokinase 1
VGAIGTEAAAPAARGTPGRLGVLTSGGDAPGMNAAIRAVVRCGLFRGARMVGVRRGFLGLLQGDLVEMEPGSVADIIHRGGTVLGTARAEVMRTAAGQAAAVAGARAAGLDGLVVIGGEGSLHATAALEALGLPTAFVPATIDNDVPGTEQCIGFDTAVNTVVQAIDRIRDTATAHERTFVVEVMGRRAGHIALTAGLGAGAESILVPEVAIDLDDVCQRLLRGRARGKRHSIIVVAEGAGAAYAHAKEVERRTGLETRVIVLGHVQRGGSPTAADRALAARLGAAAVGCLLAGTPGRMASVAGGRVRTLPYAEALAAGSGLDVGLFELAAVLST